MPNPKTGTVTMDVKKAISDIKGGKIDFKVDKTGIIHASIGKASFSADKIFENADELIRTIEKIKMAVLLPYINTNYSPIRRVPRFTGINGTKWIQIFI